MRKLSFFIIWVILIAVAVFTLFRVTSLSFALSYPVRITNFIERGLGLIVFNLLFVQIVLGFFMGTLTRKLGQWVLKFHVINGILAYLLAFFHAFSYVLINYFSGHGMDIYVAFINVCLICKEPVNYYLTIGRVAFWILTVGVFAAVFRKHNLWFSKNWRNLHTVNYVVFVLAAAHGFLLGTDFRTMPFFALAIVEIFCVLIILFFDKIPQFYKFFRNWVKN